MIKGVATISEQAKYWVSSKTSGHTYAILKTLSRSLERELNKRLKELTESPDAYSNVRSKQLAIENLTNAHAAIKRAVRQRLFLKSEESLELLSDLMSQTSSIFQNEILSEPCEAREIGIRTLNLLFRAEQSIKQKLDIGFPSKNSSQNIDLFSAVQTELQPVIGNSVQQKKSCLAVSSSLLYQLHHTLFPAEKMIVCAGSRNGTYISIEAVFEVTGRASAGHVKADPNRLGRALISMHSTDTFLCLWVHSHPGSGPGMTFPSSTDLNQHADWLKHYSSNLVSAIVVEDRFIRFWGTALEEGKISLEIKGSGVKKVSTSENIYQLQY